MVCPPLRLCMDNGVMVAWTGMLRLRLGLAERPLGTATEAEMMGMCVEVRPRWPIGPRDRRSTTQKEQLSKRKQPPPAADGANGGGAKGSKRGRAGAATVEGDA